MTTKEFKEKYNGIKTEECKKEIAAEIYDYFKRKLPQYDSSTIRVKEYIHPDDWFLARVIAKKKPSHHNPQYGGAWAVWTCWNATTKSLEHGHYDLSEEIASEIFEGEHL